MHTRRVGAFLVGAWLLGTLLVWFLTGQSILNVDRILSSPPPAVAKEFEDIGSDVSRQILRYQALQFNRHVGETWEVIQLGIGGALLATAFLTAHRSRFVIIGALLMTLMTAMMAFVLTPLMNSLGRSFDFLPATAAIPDRENFQFYLIWHRVLEVLKTVIGLAIGARLLFDRYNWRDKLSPAPQKQRRRRRTHSHREETAAAEPESPEVTTDREED